MTALRRIAHSIGSTGVDAPPYRVDLHAGRHHLVADEPPSEGGGDLGPTPLGLLVSALAACTATTLRMYAARKGWELAGITVDVRYGIDDAGQASIARTITVPPGLPAEQRARLGAVAGRTPVTLAIRTPIATDVQTGPAAT
jgi:putative redox protein